MNPADHQVFQDHLNAREADYQTLALLARNGAARARGDMGRSALHYAAAGNDLPAIARLIAGGADVNARADGGEPPLFDALSQPVLRALHLAGADLNAQDHLGHTMLHRKACEGDAAALRWMVDLGAAVDRVDRDGNTALHTAAWLGDPDTIEVLVQAGTPFLRLNHQGQTALDIAVASGCQAVVQQLEQAFQAARTAHAQPRPAWLEALVQAVGDAPPGPSRSVR